MILAMVENMSNKSNDYKRDAQSDEIKSFIEMNSKYR